MYRLFGLLRALTAVLRVDEILSFVHKGQRWRDLSPPSTYVLSMNDDHMHCPQLTLSHSRAQKLQDAFAASGLSSNPIDLPQIAGESAVSHSRHEQHTKCPPHSHRIAEFVSILGQWHACCV